LKKKRTKYHKIALGIWLVIAVTATTFVIIYSEPKLLIKTSRSLVKLFTLVGVACFIGAIFEYKAWSRFAAWLAIPLIRFGRLPEISGAAFVTAIFSNNAANTLVASSYKAGNITRKEMFISGLCNSFPAMVSHSLRILPTLLGLIGMAAIGYYAFTFGTGFIMTITFLFISRLISKKNDNKDYQLNFSEKEFKTYPWNEVIRKSLKRATSTVLRLFYITTPIYLTVAYMIKHNMFNFWKEMVPESMNQWLSPEIMAVLAARLGGLVNAAGVASEFFAQNKIEYWQIVLAFMVGNVITNPIRTLRRNLPAAIGIFPGKNGLWIVLILQSLRLITTIIGIILLINFYS